MSCKDAVAKNLRYLLRFFVFYFFIFIGLVCNFILFFFFVTIWYVYKLIETAYKEAIKRKGVW